MKGKVNTFLYFLASRLQITAAEKTLVLLFGGLLILVSGSRQVLSAVEQPGYGSTDYDDRVALFQQRAERVREELSALQEQYYPGERIAEPSTEVMAETNPDPGISEATDTEPPAVAEAPEPTEQQTAPGSQEAKVNINTATSAQLESLPGIGPAIAARIVEHRNTNGPFERIEDIKNVRGIAEGRFEAIADLITTGKEKED